MIGYWGLREGVAWIDLGGRGKIRVTGVDRARLLHAMCTQHILELAPGGGHYAFFLNAQGRILADAIILCRQEDFLLDTEPETGAKLREHLDRYIIADDVTLEDQTDALTTLAVEGPRAGEVEFPHPDAPYSHVAWGSALVVRASFTGAPGWRIIAPAAERAEILRRLGDIEEADAEAARTVRIENGKPRYGEDILESTLPQETQVADALHFNKGCYLGQEIVERIRSRGHVNRLLTRIEAGEATSSAFSPALGKVVALGYVHSKVPGLPS